MKDPLVPFEIDVRLNLVECLLQQLYVGNVASWQDPAGVLKQLRETARRRMENQTTASDLAPQLYDRAFAIQRKLITETETFFDQVEADLKRHGYL